MIRFECDYGEGAHPKILEALTQTNLEQTAGYGLDPHCDHARELICQACQAPEAAVEFLVGGTQANATVIAAILRPYQGALCAQTGHINVHETGAIEASGHKVLPLPAKEGKSPLRKSAAPAGTTGRTPPMSISSSPVWSISPSPPRRVPSIPAPNWRTSVRPAMSTTCPCTSTGPGAAMAWVQRRTT